jgi:hypothetical protein
MAQDDRKQRLVAQGRPHENYGKQRENNAFGLFARRVHGRVAASESFCAGDGRLRRNAVACGLSC